MSKEPLFWKELFLSLGDNIQDVAKTLVEHAPAFCIFNGFRLEAEPLDTVEIVIKKYLKGK